MAYQSLYRKYRPAAIRRAGRPGARDHRAAERGARRPGRARLPVLGSARHREDHDRPHPRQGAQLPRPRPRRRRVRRVRELRRDRRGAVPRPLRARRGVEQQRRRHPRAHGERAPRARAHREVQGVPHRRGAHALGERIQCAAQDARGTARARGVRARHHRPGACAPHDQVAHPALRVHAVLPRRAQLGTWRVCASAKECRPTRPRSR